MTRDKKIKAREARPYSTCECHFERSEKTTHEKSKFIFPFGFSTDSSLRSEGHPIKKLKRAKRDPLQHVNVISNVVRKLLMKKVNSFSRLDLEQIPPFARKDTR